MSRRFRGFTAKRCSQPIDQNNRCITCDKLFDLISGRIPLKLDCDHTICETCILDWPRNSTNIRCSKCSAETLLHKKSKQTVSDGLKPNFDLVGTLLMQSLNDGASSIRNENGIFSKCAWCPTESSMRCDICESLFCDQCLAKHSQQHPNHLIVSKYVNFCEQHKQNIKDTKCLQCNIVICPHCMLANHKGHDYKLTSGADVDEEFKSLMNDCQKKLEAIEKSEMENLQSPIAENKVGERVKYIEALQTALQRKLTTLFPSDGDNATKDKKDVLIYKKFLKNLIMNANRLVANELENNIDIDLIKKLMRNVEYISADLLKTGKLTQNNNKFDKLTLADAVIKKLTELNEFIDNATNEERPMSSSSIEKGMDDVIDLSFAVSDLSMDDYDQSSTPCCSDEKQCLYHEISAMIDLKLGDIEIVKVWNLTKCNDFYVNYGKHSEAMYRLNSYIANFNLFEKITSPPKEGEIYIVKNISELINYPWVRATLLEVRNNRVTHKQEYIVKYVDFGIVKKMLRIVDFRMVPEVLRKIPFFGIKCRLHNFEHPAMALTFMRDYVLRRGNTNNKITMQKMSEFKGILSVQLFIEIDMVTFNLANMLAFLGLGSIKGPISKSLCKSDLKEIISQKDCFAEGKYYDVTAVHVVNPDKFYVALSETNTSYKQQEKDLAAAYSNNSNMVFNIEIGVCVVAKYNNLWYRASIQKILSDGYCILLLVDIGHEAKVNWKDMRKLDNEFSRLPCQAIEVKLAKIAPMAAKWDYACSKHLKEVLNEECKMEVISANKKCNEVVLYYKYRNGQTSINDSLVKHGFARLLNCGMMSYSPNCSLRNDTSSTTTNLLKQAQGKKSDEDDSDEEDESHIKDKQKIIVMNVINPFEIYVQPQDKLDLIEQVSDLHKDIQLFYSQTRLNSSKTTWDLGSIVMGHDVVKRAYFRSKILSIRNGEYNLLSIDFGHTFVAQANQIGLLDKNFRSISPGCIGCSLYGIKPQSSEWSLTASDCLKEFVQNKPNVYMKRVPNAVKNPMQKNPSVVLWKREIIPGSALKRNNIRLININKRLVKYGVAFKLPELDTAFKVPVIEIDSDSDSDLSVVIEGENQSDWLQAVPFTETNIYGQGTWVDSNSNVYFHLWQDKNDIEEMTETISDHVRLRRTNEKQKTDWMLNNICLAQYHIDCKWYRAKILEIIEDCDDVKYKVCMVDFGNEEIVRAEELHVANICQDVPIYAHKVAMPKMPPHLKASDLDFLHSKIVLKNINVEIVIWSDPPQAIVTVDGVNMNEYIKKYVKQKPAEKVYRFRAFPHPRKFAAEIVNFLLTYEQVVFSLETPRSQFAVLEEEIFARGDLQPQLECFDNDTACVARFSDGKWYRGQIASQYAKNDDPNLIPIYFVDYGNMENVPKSDVRVIKPTWFKYPLEFFIAKLNMKMIKDSEKIASHFKSYINSKKMIDIVSHTPLVIDLYDIDTSQLAYQSLVEDGLIVLNKGFK